MFQSCNRKQSAKRTEVPMDEYNPSKEVKVHKLELQFDSESLISPNLRRELSLIPKMEKRNESDEDPLVYQLFDGTDIDLFVAGNQTGTKPIENSLKTQQS